MSAGCRYHERSLEPTMAMEQPPDSKLWVYNATIISVLLYSIEMWLLSKALVFYIHGLEPSELLMRCTGLILCSMRNSASEPSSQASSASLLSTIFAGLDTSCKNLMITLPESSTSSICQLETTLHQTMQLLERRCLSRPPADSSGIGRCSDTLPRPSELEGWVGSHGFNALMAWDLAVAAEGLHNKKNVKCHITEN